MKHYCDYWDKCIHYGNRFICNHCKHYKGKRSYFEPRRETIPWTPRNPWEPPWRCISSNLYENVSYSRW